MIGFINMEVIGGFEKNITCWKVKIKPEENKFSKE